MGQPRSQLHQILKTFTTNVYFQPPNELTMKYPAIVYHRDFADSKFANNKTYANTKRYQVTIIDEDPDSEIPDKVAALPMCTFSRFFAVDGLNQDIYDLYF
jgi:hypothetical protein